MTPAAHRSAGIEADLRRALRGEVRFDAFTRGRYATDASFYQIMPAGVVIPKDRADLTATVDIAARAGLSLTARGGGTSQCGQTVNHGLILDTSRYFDRILALDVEARTCTVEPGIVLDELNRALRPHGLWFPVDISTASRATIGGMAANNSCGGRSLRYGTMRDNVRSIDLIGQEGALTHFGPVDQPATPLESSLLALGRETAAVVEARFPKVNRRVGGYNIDALSPRLGPVNLSHLLVGSEGTLGLFAAIELQLAPLMGDRALGACHFPTFAAAMAAAQHLVALRPIAVELVDAGMIALARQIPLFRSTIEIFVQGDPAAILLVEFDEGSACYNARKLDDLRDVMEGLGHGGRVVAIPDPALQARVAEVRQAGLNIMMSMKEEGKPVSFIEDCAVPLADLEAYTTGLNEVFRRHGTTGTWYAHASEGCLHVRPILNLKREEDVRKMRAIAEEAFAMVAAYKGSHSGEHGDGILRSEFHERMFGPEITNAFAQVKRAFDPGNLFNPGRITDPPRMDDRSLFRFPPGYAAVEHVVTLDWSAWPGGAGGLQGAVEMCNNNGTCRKLKGAAMCPSFRATRDERDSTRGRANTLRLALTGQLGPDALTSDAMAETMALCVSCKACRRECPAGVDMARMKIEVLAARHRQHGAGLHDRLVGHLPRYASWLARMPWLVDLRDRVPGMARLMQGPTGFTAKRRLPRPAPDPFHDHEGDSGATDVVLFVDTFSRWFEPENVRAALKVLRAAGQKVAVAEAADRRPLCCGRTYLSVGMVEEAKAEARRTLEVLAPHVSAGRKFIGLEPSCLFTFRDEIPGLLPGPQAQAVAAAALTFEEYLQTHVPTGKAGPTFHPFAQSIALHGHCHQKSFSAMTAVHDALRRLPGAEVAEIETSCCGMAGAFGYGVSTEAISRRMGELALLPAVRALPDDMVLVADGTSCRHQIKHGADRRAIHSAVLLASHLVI